MAQPTTQPTVFISYSHKDEQEKEALLSHLKVLQHANLLDVWSDDRIRAGGDWEADINQTIEQASVAVLLISANFLTSDFILSKEVPKLLKRRQQEGLVVFPVVAKACAWQTVSWLAAMNVRPKNGTPVWREGGRYTDEELAKIANEIGIIVGQADSTVSASTTSPINTSSPAQVPKSVSTEIPDIPAVTTSKEGMNWEKIGAIAGVISVIVAVMAFVISSNLRALIFPPATPTPSPTATPFIQTTEDLVVRIFDTVTKAPVPQVEVAFFPEDSADFQLKTTDDSGLVRFSNAIYEDKKFIRITCSNENYETFDKTTTIYKDNPIFDVFLQPK